MSFLPLRGDNNSPPNALSGFEGSLCGRGERKMGRKGGE